MRAFYDQDLAYVHHVGFGELVERGGPEIIALLRSARLDAGLVIDLGCGSGTWARALLDAGFDVRGVDVSPAMIALARQTAPEATFQVASLAGAALVPCVAVTALGEVLSYRLDQSAGQAALAGLAERVAASLPPGGLFVFDVVVSGEPPMRYRSWSKGSDWAVLVAVDEEPEQGLLSREITVFRGTGRGYRRSEERHLVRVLPASGIERLLRRAGFQVTVAPGYGDYRLGARRLAFIARRRGA